MIKKLPRWRDVLAPRCLFCAPQSLRRILLRRFRLCNMRFRGFIKRRITILTWLCCLNRLRPPCSRSTREAIDLFIKTGADSVISMVEVQAEYHPYWQFTIGKNDRLSLFTGDSIGKTVSRRQDLPKTYQRNGVLYVFKPGLVFDSNPSIYGNNVHAYPMDPQYSSDINNPGDWVEAEAKMRTILDKLSHNLI